jgi:5'-methylthioadenosine phosphorylase
MHQNSGNAQKVVKAAVRMMPIDLGDSPAQTAAKFAIMTDRAVIPAETKKKLDLLYGKYW